ncbi:phage terminase large subunit [Bradyrhizobium yuanmingense]|uniref:phage terminase large subunit n=1 Tax=Bradyrhizobium yuanmingense TaxID=108015 RepID=UPI001CD587E6|nr:phage terminase large subunit [Bradyrhizobium yuanmingense]MCA1528762.1 phage terminase large subunit [Bradyrhizobium yuanmingense]
MTAHDFALLSAILRADFVSFVYRCFLHLNPGARFLPNWHIQAIAYQLERVRRGELTRLIINMPPRYLKSITVSVAFSAFLLGHAPGRRIISLSYGDDLSAKHASDFRSIVHAEWYRRAFPDMRIARSTESELITTRRGSRRTTSVSGTLTGLGGDLILIDDPQKPADAQSEARRIAVNQWVTNTLMSRLDNKRTSSVILVMQRVHLDDLSGFLASSSDEWKVLSLPAIAESDAAIPIGPNQFHFRKAGEALHPAHESIEMLRKLQQTLGPDVFAAQYQQAPVPAGGALIKRNWLRYYDEPPSQDALGCRIIQSWDTAAKNGAQNDWSVCTTWLVVDGTYYLLDLVRGRFEYPALRDTAIELARRFKPHEILIEEASTGIALAQELSDRTDCFVNPIKVEHDKIGRLYVQQAKFAAGRVRFPRNAPFLPDLEMELLTFPQGRHDDQVDSISQALAYDDTNGYDHTFSWL